MIDSESSDIDPGRDSYSEVEGLGVRRTDRAITGHEYRLHRKEKDPIRYAGKADWLDYLRHFEAVSAWNQWGYHECGLQLAISLVDEAREVLSSLPRHLQNDYNSLVEALTSAL